MTKPEPSKSPSASAVIKTEIVLPVHTNALGTIFGGTVMAWIDVAAAIAAERHARSIVVTASIDALHFLSPIRLGEIVTILAQVNFTHRTSIEVGVRVDTENPLTGEKRHCAKAYTTFVALDEVGRPKQVPALVPETELDKKRFSEAQKRRASRIQLAEELKKIG